MNKQFRVILIAIVLFTAGLASTQYLTKTSQSYPSVNVPVSMLDYTIDTVGITLNGPGQTAAAPVHELLIEGKPVATKVTVTNISKVTSVNLYLGTLLSPDLSTNPTLAANTIVTIRLNDENGELIFKGPFSSFGLVNLQPFNDTYATYQGASNTYYIAIELPASSSDEGNIYSNASLNWSWQFTAYGVGGLIPNTINK